MKSSRKNQIKKNSKAKAVSNNLKSQRKFNKEQDKKASKLFPIVAIGASAGRSQKAKKSA